jgi:integrase
MAKRKITDRTLKALKPAPKGKHYDVWDVLIPAFGVRVSDTGRKTFVLAGRFGGAKHPTRRALGTYPAMTLEAARKEAGKWISIVERGGDPSALKKAELERERQEKMRRERHSFAAVAEKFIEYIHRQKLRTAHEMERDLRKEFVERWQARPITEITSDDVKRVIKDAVDRGKIYRAHGLFALIRRMFNWAIGTGDYGLQINPCGRLKPVDLIGEREERARVLTDHELLAFWRATGRLPFPWQPLFRALLVTMQRRSEVAGARRSEFDFAAKIWTIPPDRMKMNGGHSVPLSPLAMEIFGSCPEFKRGDCLFSTTFGEKPVQGFSKAKARLDELMQEELRKLTTGRADKTKLTPWRLHDLRRTGRTALSKLRVPEMVAELVIAHAKPGLHKVYNQHDYLDERRDALNAWDAHLRSVIDPGSASNVVELKSRA